MKTFGKSIIIFTVFAAGTMSLIHVDRQCAIINGSSASIMSSIENIIEK